MRKPNVTALMAAVLLAGFAAGAAAESPCAVGGFVTGRSNTAVGQVLAFTTNATFFYTYSFAITSGTSGCSSSGIIQREYEQEFFVAYAHDGLEADMARGEGDYLRAFAALMGCGEALYPEFARWSQAHVGHLASLSQAPATPRAWVAEARRELAAHPRLAGCARLS